LVFGIGLGNLDAVETLVNTIKVTWETMTTKIEPTSNSRPHAHFSEHLVCVIENPP
jgi:hypothetical protein